nr:hypothetical protein [Tanacetum cinerariifolium]
MIGECSCFCDDGVLDDGTSWSMEVNTGESAKSVSLGAAAIGTEETAIVEGLNYSSNIEMDVEQAFWLRISNPTSKPSDASPVKIKAPKELFKVSLVNKSLKELKFHFARFDNVVKIRTTLDARKEGYQNPFHLKKAQRIKPNLYDGIVISDKHVAMPVIDDEETLILKEKSRLKMFEKAKDPEIIGKNISHKPIDYEKLNRLSEDFGKHFTSQQEMDVEQAFWLRISNPTSKPSDASPVKIEAPKELFKVSLVNKSLKELKFHFARFDNVVKIRTTPDARKEGEWGFEHTKAVFNNEIIPFLKYLKYIFSMFDRDLLTEIMEVQTTFNQMEAVVQQFLVDKQCLKIAKKELLLEND